MLGSRIMSRFVGTLLNRCRTSPQFSGRKYVSSFSDQLLSPTHKVVSGWLGSLHHSAQFPSAFQRFGFSSSATPQPNGKETAQTGNEQENGVTNQGASAVDASDHSEASTSMEKAESQSNVSGTRRRSGTRRVAFSDSESDSDLESNLSRDDLVKLVAEKEQLLVTKLEELDKMKDKVLRTMAEMENVKERTRRESENAKKFAIQSFAKSLLDVTDNLGRASSAAKEGFTKVDEHKDGAIQQLKVLLEGVEMTEKQLLEVFKKFGLERYDPINEEFDPNRHYAVFQVPDSSKPKDHIAAVLKVLDLVYSNAQAGYILHDRVIRPAEVGVYIGANN